MVTSKCVFWNDDIRWASSMHDSNLWNHFVLGQFCEAGRSSPYVLIGDVAYLIRPWMFPPYKWHKDGFSQKNIIGILSKV